jgi:hypothetical protein
VARPAVFWAGLWQGLIIGIAFLVSLFDSGVGIYETNKNERLYNFGFLLGISTLASQPEVRQVIDKQ